MSEPEAVEWSWIDPRETVGRGRVQWAIFPPDGVYLTGGTLDLGIIRDSTLNATNDFQVFGETFVNGAGITIGSTKADKCLGTVTTMLDRASYDKLNGRPGE